MALFLSLWVGSTLLEHPPPLFLQQWNDRPPLTANAKNQITLFSYSAEWLFTRNLGNPAVRENRKKIYLGLDQIKTWNNEEITKRLKTFKHDDVMNDDKVEIKKN